MPKTPLTGNLTEQTLTQQPDFKTAFITLRNHAQTLQASQETDIDALLDVVSESIAAYKVCQNRILAIQQALDEAFSET